MRLKELLVFALVMNVFACRQQEYGLNPTPRQTDTFAVVQKVVNHLGEKDFSKTVNLEFALQFLEKGDSSNKFAFRITRLNLDSTVSYLERVVNFDSLQAAVARSFYNISLDKAGRVIAIRGEEQLRENVFSVFSSRYIAQNFIDDHLGANAVSDLLNRLFLVVPYKEIKEGDKWVKDLMLVTKAPVKVSEMFAYQRQSGDSVFIQHTAVISADQGNPSAPYMKGREEGEVVISARTGMPYFYDAHAALVTTTTAGDRSTDEFYEIRRLNRRQPD